MTQKIPDRPDTAEPSGVAQSDSERWVGDADAQPTPDAQRIAVEVDVQEVDGAIASPISEDTWSHWFQIWLTDLAPELSPIGAYELSLRLTTDAEVQQLNAQYRHIDRATDVLSFSAAEAEIQLPQSLLLEMPFPLGDIVISLETASVQAQQRRHSLSEELAWLATHGLLHLLGWDHPDEERLQKMLQQQVNLLQTVGLKVQYD